MNALAAVLICGGIYAIGDYVSSRSKAMLPMLFVSGFLLLVGFWTLLPPTLLEDTGLFGAAALFAPVFVVHLGTMLNLDEIIREWKTVLIALASVAAITGLLLLVGSQVIGLQYSAAAAGPISGGLVAVLIIQETAGTMGLNNIAVFVTILFVVQLFVGLPIAAACLSREAKHALEHYRREGGEMGTVDASMMGASEPKWRIFPELSQNLQTPFVLLFKLLLVTWLALSFSDLTGGTVNKFVAALAFGILFKELGLLEVKVLDRANGSGLTLFLLFLLVYWYLPKATPELLVSMVVPILAVFALAIASVAITALLSSKLFGYSWLLCMALGISCMFGFPGTYIIPEEVAKAHARDEQERDYIINLLMPKMLVAGFTTVSIASVFIASFMVRFL